ncbi:MAG TPA: T9SS type A sorting domain-containing protein, partial [Ignavibacteria bacterium]|nr:T9SS type A sorting domain-containing protein [Ignavibacteria bacterium]
MKLVKLIIPLAVTVFSLTSYGQYPDLPSVVNPNFTDISPAGTPSLLQITNGYDNIFLGTDFGEPYIATNPRDLFNSVCAYNFNSFYYTLDGYNWVKTFPPFPGYNTLGDPVMTFDSLGNIYYAQLYQNGSTYGVVVNKSTNKGVSWLAAYNAYSTTAGLADKEWIVADQTGGPYSNYVYLGWRQFGSTGMRFVRSTNLGVTWSSPLTFAGGQGAYVSVGANGNIQGGSVYFAATSGGGILVNRSTDGGATFSAQEWAAFTTPPGVPCGGRNTVKNCIRIDDFPRMAADNSYTSTRGNVYIAYCSNPGGPDNADIYVTRSTDYGVTWSAAVRVNDDATITDQFIPTISVDNQTGKIFICWYDSRVDPAANLLTRIYGATSTNGGISFTTNVNLSDVSFNPNTMTQNQGTHNYIGDYIGISAIRNTGYAAWMDSRNNNLGSYAGFYPDYAMTVNPSEKNIVNNDSTTFSVTVPSIKGPFSEAVKFTAALDTLPQAGTIQLTFVNGKDSVNNFPDSVYLRVRTIGTVTPRMYRLNITGKAKTTGLPIHIRTVNLLVNVSRLTIGTNRSGICDFKVNNVQYNNTQQLIFPNASAVTVQAISPKTVGFTRYVYTNWSDNGDTTHIVTLNSNLTLTAFYKAQYKLQINSTPGNTFGGNDFFDSATTRTFGVLSRDILYQGNWYQFKGWTGSGNGSYTSPDTTGNDTSATVTLRNPIVETANWRTPPIGVKQNGTEIPKVFMLYQNFPNPFNPVTTITFDIPSPSNVNIIVYDLLGREVETVVNQLVEPGKFTIDFNSSNYASGVYFYRIDAQAVNKQHGEYSSIKKMVILK